MVTSSKYTAVPEDALLAVNKTKPAKTPSYRTVGNDKSSFRAVLASRARDKTQVKDSWHSSANLKNNAGQTDSQKQVRADEDAVTSKAVKDQVNSNGADKATEEAVDQVKDTALLVPEREDSEDTADAESATLAEAAALMAILSVDLVELEHLNATLPQDQSVSLEVKQSLDAMIDSLKAQLSTLVSDTTEPIDLKLDLETDSQVEMAALKALVTDTTEQFESFLKADAATVSAAKVEALETLLSDLNGHIEKMFKATDVNSELQMTANDNLSPVQLTATETAGESTADTSNDETTSDATAIKATDVKQSTDEVKSFSEVAGETTLSAVEGDRQDIAQIKATQNVKQNQLSTKTAVFEQIKAAIEKDSTTAGLADRSTMIVKLKPEALGKVELKIEVHNDNVIAKFNVASQMVKEAIESNFDDLRNSLKDKGFSDLAFDVNVNSGSGDEKRDSFNQRQNRRRTINIPNDAEKGETTYIRSLSALINETTFEHSI